MRPLLAKSDRSRSSLRVGGLSRGESLPSVRRRHLVVRDTTRDRTQNLEDKGLGVKAAAFIAGTYDLFHWGARNNRDAALAQRKRLRIPEIAYGPSIEQSPRGLRWVRSKFKNYFLLGGVRMRRPSTYEEQVRRNRVVFLTIVALLAGSTVFSLI